MGPSRGASAANVRPARPLVPRPVKAASNRTRRRDPTKVRVVASRPIAAATVLGARAVAAGVVAAEGATASDYARRYAPRPGAAALHTTEWTDRALGNHAGSTVGLIWGLGALGVDSRGPRTDGRVAHARAHGVQGHAQPLGQGYCARPRSPRRVARRVHRARAHVVSGASTG